MSKFREVRNQKGGMIQNLLFLAALAALGYFGYQYFLNKPGASNPTASADGAATATGETAHPSGSMAGQAVQGAQAAGEVLGSGR